MALTTRNMVPEATVEATPLHLTNNEPVRATPPVLKGKTVKIVLHLYTTYRRGADEKHGIVFEKGKIYEVTEEQADILLNEVDHDRPIFKKHVPVLKPSQRKNPDLTLADLKPLSLSDIPGDLAAQELGDEDELAEIAAREQSVGVEV